MCMCVRDSHYCIADVCIVGVARTPMGGLSGSLSSFAATKLGSIAIQGTLDISSNVLYI